MLKLFKRCKYLVFLVYMTLYWRSWQGCHFFGTPCKYLKYLPNSAWPTATTHQVRLTVEVCNLPCRELQHACWKVTIVIINNVRKRVVDAIVIFAAAAAAAVGCDDAASDDDDGRTSDRPEQPARRVVGPQLASLRGAARLARCSNHSALRTALSRRLSVRSYSC